MAQNRRDRRAARAQALKNLPDEARVLLDALVSVWLEDTEAGHVLASHFGLARAKETILDLHKRGLVDFVTGPAEAEGQLCSFEIKLPPTVLKALLEGRL